MCDEDRAGASRPAGGMQGDEMTKTVADSVREWEHAGMRCVRRCGMLGAPCGYVEVPEGHPLYGVEFWDFMNDVLWDSYALHLNEGSADDGDGE